MKRIFKIVVDNKPTFFEHKKEAKKAREELKAQDKKVFVNRGPDHHRGESTCT